jgi:hypothetical protein
MEQDLRNVRETGFLDKILRLEHQIFLKKPGF